MRQTDSQQRVNPDASLCADSTGTAFARAPTCANNLSKVLERRQGVNFRVNKKQRGEMFGEVALMYNVPRSATVAATKDSVVWVLERDIYRCGPARWALPTVFLVFAAAAAAATTSDKLDDHARSLGPHCQLHD